MPIDPLRRTANTQGDSPTNSSQATWSGVLPSTYTAKMLRSTSANCNGILPGKGNYSLTYTVYYQQ